MRIGKNPAKGTQVESHDTYHRIVIPVYIPNFEGFFAQTLDVLKLTLQSIYTTVHEKTSISVVSNGSCLEVNTFLSEELEARRIDELFVVKAGIGKINSIFKAVNNAIEPIITLTDADVLFTTGWQQAVEQTFLDYKKVGMVCPFSYNKGFRELTANIYFDTLLGNKIKKIPMLNPTALDHFAESIGNKNFYKPIQKKWGIGYSEKGKTPVLIGAGHFVASFRRGVFKPFTFNPNLRKIANGERQYIDTPAVTYNLWRVSTQKNYVFHMGNTIIEAYNEQILKNMKDAHLSYPDNFKVKKLNKVVYWFKNKLLAKIIYSNTFLKLIFKKAGFTKQETNEYFGA